jgi:hypothetical protein
MAVRKSISKKTRFEVFKRDGFRCVYCASHPPEVILHVDHVVAVAAGGTNDIDNLVTACEPCNQGKGARDIKVAPQTLAEKAVMVAEAEAQLLGYQEILQARRDRLEDETWRVADILEPGSPSNGYPRDWLTSITRFIEKLGVHDVLGAAEIAYSKYRLSRRRCFLYFCGICWKRVRGEGVEG